MFQPGLTGTYFLASSSTHLGTDEKPAHGARARTRLVVGTVGEAIVVNGSACIEIRGEVKLKNTRFELHHLTPPHLATRASSGYIF